MRKPILSVAVLAGGIMLAISGCGLAASVGVSTTKTQDRAEVQRCVDMFNATLAMSGPANFTQDLAVAVAAGNQLLATAGAGLPSEGGGCVIVVANKTAGGTVAQYTSVDGEPTLTRGTTGTLADLPKSVTEHWNAVANQDGTISLKANDPTLT